MIRVDDREFYHFVKLPYSNEIDMLFSLRAFGENMSISDQLSYCGVYDKENHKLYDPSYMLQNNILKDDDYTSLYEITKDMETQINDIIKHHVIETREQYPKEDYEFSWSEIHEAEKIFIAGKDKIEYNPSFKIYSENDAIKYLTEGDDYLFDVSFDYINNHQDSIKRELNYVDKVNSYLTEILNNKENPLHKTKAVIDSLKDKDYIKVHVFINRDGQDYDFKIDTDTLRGYYSDDISIYYLTANERDQYEECFGDCEDIKYEDIVKIEYRNNAVYEDEEFYQKQADEMIL